MALIPLCLKAAGIQNQHWLHHHYPVLVSGPISTKNGELDIGSCNESLISVLDYAADPQYWYWIMFKNK